jgi:hypothetical protein
MVAGNSICNTAGEYQNVASGEFGRAWDEMVATVLPIGRSCQSQEIGGFVPVEPRLV